MDSILRDFSRAESLLVAMVSRTLATSNLASLRARRRASREVSKLLDQLRSLTAPKAAALVRSSYLAGREASLAGNKTLSDMDRNALQIIIDNLGGRLEDSLATVGRRVDDIYRREGLRAAAQAIAKGAVDDDAVKRFHDKLVKDGITSFTDKSGRKWGLETYAKMSLKTTMMEATNTGAENLIRERGFDIIQIGHTGRFEPDKLCSPHHNKKYSLFGRTSSLPLFTPSDKPPYHPNCEHFIKLAPEAASERRSALRAA